MLKLDLPKLWASVTDASRLSNSPVRAVGVRGANTPTGGQNSFAHYDDLIFIEIDGVVTTWTASTDPSWALVVHPINPDGAAQLTEGVWLFGPVLMHAGTPREHPAFGQIEHVKVNRLDHAGNIITTQTGQFGIDLHSGGEGMDTGRFSAGCQIIQNPDGYFQQPFWGAFYNPLHAALQRHGLSKFPYLLTTLAKLQAGGFVL